MSFVSERFVFFSLIFFAAYFLSPSRFRPWVILVASYAFCGAWNFMFLAILLVSTITNWVFAQKVAADQARARSYWLIAGVTFNILLLGLFKYLNFFITSFSQVSDLIGLDFRAETIKLLVPLGISFYTFQAISLLVDVRRKKLDPPSLFECAFLFAFWPKLIAGPIVRGVRLIPQVRAPKTFRWPNFWLGTEAILYGLAFKVLLSDYLAPEINKVYGAPGSYSPADNIVAALLYTFQIYGDFAGYSLMAIGFARIMGYSIGPNFRRPNFARSFSDFWSRWHISLSRFLGDYVYRSLPRRSRNEVTTSRNLMVTMLVSGLWHGPAWTFVTWGGFHGLMLIGQRQLWGRLKGLYARQPWLARVSIPLQILSVFILVCVSRVFFRSNSLHQAGVVFGRIAASAGGLGSVQNLLNVAVCFVIIGAFCAVELMVECGAWARLKRRRYFRMACAIFVMLCVMVLGEFKGGQFVYVRF